MMLRICSALLLAASISAASSAYAASTHEFEMQKEHTLTLKSGKTVKVMVGKMNGHMMVAIPMDEWNEILMRAEGHSMTTP